MRPGLKRMKFNLIHLSFLLIERAELIYDIILKKGRFCLNILL